MISIGYMGGGGVLGVPWLGWLHQCDGRVDGFLESGSLVSLQCFLMSICQVFFDGGYS